MLEKKIIDYITLLVLAAPIGIVVIGLGAWRKIPYHTKPAQAPLPNNYYMYKAYDGYCISGGPNRMTGVLDIVQIGVDGNVIAGETMKRDVPPIDIGLPGIELPDEAFGFFILDTETHDVRLGLTENEAKVIATELDAAWPRLEHPDRRWRRWIEN